MLWRVLYDQFEEQTKWNPQVALAQVLSDLVFNFYHYFVL